MAIKMRILYASGKKKMLAFANEIKAKHQLAFNAVDVIPPAYPCDKERIVILAISAKGNDICDPVVRFCQELTKARAQNVALMIDGDATAANKIKEILVQAGTNVYDEVIFVNGGFPIFGTTPKPEEKTAVLDWIDRVIANLK